MKTVKFICIFIPLFVLFLPGLISADVPQMINYQGRLVTSEGDVVDTSVSMVFAIYNDSAGALPLWTETHALITVEDGDFSVLLGEINPISDTVFNGHIRYLGVKVGIAPEGRPLNPLVSVAYAYSAKSDDDWSKSGDNLYRLDGNVGIRTNNPTNKLTHIGDFRLKNAAGDSLCTIWRTSDHAGLLNTHGSNGSENINLSNSGGGNGDQGNIVLKNSLSFPRMYMSLHSGTEEGGFLAFGPNGNYNAVFVSTPNNENHGHIGAFDYNNVSKVDISVDDLEDLGEITTFGPSQSANARLTNHSGSPDFGAIAVYNSSDQDRAMMFAHPDYTGRWMARGSNGNYNIHVRNTSNADRGSFEVYDASQNFKAGIQINGSGQGFVFGDGKSFRMENPNQQDTEIWYTCLEGPEVPAYIRGTAKLSNGKAIITFPDHFKAVASEEGITVQLTPLSADSKGLTLAEKSLEKVVVAEMYDGKGSYEFDYLVMAVRKGYEDYQVIKPCMDPDFDDGIDAPDEIKSFNFEGVKYETAK